MVLVEYLIDPVREVFFLEVMQATRRAGLSQGVLSWGLFRDASQPGCYAEHFVDEDWVAPALARALHRRRQGVAPAASGASHMPVEASWRGQPRAATSSGTAVKRSASNP